MIKPTDLNQVTECLRQAQDEKQSLYLAGTGTKSAFHEAPASSATLSMADFSGIVDYDPEELVLVVKSGTLLTEIEALLASRQQMLAFEPPDLSAVLGATHSGTMGGVIATNLSGSRRLSAGAARDYLLGFDGISGRADYFKSGSRVMKNVTGYDLSKLMCGSYGTLAVLGELTLKVLPKPQSVKSLVFSVDNLAQAQSILAQAFHTATEPSGAALYRNGDKFDACIRLEGVEISVSDRVNHLCKTLATPSFDVQIIEDEAAKTLWQKIGNIEQFIGQKGQIWKLSITPNRLSAIIEACEKHGACDFVADWAGGLVWLLCEGDKQGTKIRSIIAENGGGHAHLMRTSHASDLAVFHPQPEAVHALQRRIKTAFDPMDILNSAIMGFSAAPAR